MPRLFFITKAYSLKENMLAASLTLCGEMPPKLLPPSFPVLPKSGEDAGPTETNLPRHRGYQKTDFHHETEKLCPSHLTNNPTGLQYNKRITNDKAARIDIL